MGSLYFFPFGMRETRGGHSSPTLTSQPKAGNFYLMKQTAAGEALTVRWRYIALPVVLLLLSIILVVYFYRLLPAELAYHFKSDGSPDRWLSRGAIVLWTLLPQLFLTLLSAAITWGIKKLSGFFLRAESARIEPASIISVMGNMVALPQIIIFFTVLDIFSYNSFQTPFLPLWVLVLIILGLGSIILGIFFIRAIRQVWVASR